MPLRLPSLTRTIPHSWRFLRWSPSGALCILGSEVRIIWSQILRSHMMPDGIFSAASQQGHAQHLVTQDTGENERCHNSGVRLDDELRCRCRKLAPCDLLVWNSTRVRAVARGRIADLAEIAPARN